jgi:cobalt-zinc-cadmium efflux system protein
MTAHVVRSDGVDCAFLEATEHALDHTFGLKHVTLQVEPAPCASRHELHP